MFILKRSSDRWCNKPLAEVFGRSIPAELAVLGRQLKGGERGAWLTPCAKFAVVDLVRASNGEFQAEEIRLPDFVLNAIQRILRETGLKKGVPDLVIWSNAAESPRFIEVKRFRRDRLSVEQNKFLTAAGKNGSIEEWDFSKWSWKDAVVDGAREHIELRYGDASQTPYGQWRPVALVGRPERRVFPVQWLMVPGAADESVIEEARRELDFYLIEKREQNPWGYAVYHCGTSANMYSSVHWSHFPSGQRGERRASKIVQLSAQEAAEVFGETNKPREPEDR